MLGLAFWGVATRAKALAVVTRETQAAGGADCYGRLGGARRAAGGDLAARIDTGIHRRVDLRAHQRLPEAAARRHRIARARRAQLLAEIDTPELDSQLQQARADLGTAEANSRLAMTTAERYRDLIKTESVSQQDLDNANGNLEAKQAAVESAKANVQAARAAARLPPDRSAV